MKILVAIIAGLAGVGVAAPQAAAPAGQGLATIQGTVTDSVSGEPLRKAAITIQRENPSKAYSAMSSETGRFTVEGVEPGTYFIAAEHWGFVEITHNHPDGQTVRLGAGESLTGVRVRMTPQGVLSGRVVDDEGDVWTRGHVGVSRAVFRRGKRQIEGVNTVDLDDRGEFRIAGLSPGRYYLSAELDSKWDSDHRPRTDKDNLLQPTWYPSVLQQDGASAIVLGPGREVSGLEIRLRRGKTHRIRGMLSGIESLPRFPDRAFSGRSISARSTTGFYASATALPNGSFEIPRVPPGTYSIDVRQGFPPIWLGETSVEVRDRDVEGVTIQLTPPRAVKGLVRVEGDGELKPAGLLVWMGGYGWNDNIYTREDGTFDVPLVSSEHHNIGIRSVAGQALYLKKIRYGDIESTDGGVVLRGPEATLELLVSTRGALLTGTINRESNTVSGKPQLVLARKDGKGEPRVGVFDQNGVFSFENLAPAAYRAYAFDDAPDGAWEDEDFLKEFSSTGVEVELKENDSKSIEVPLTLKAKLLPVLQRLGME